MLKPLNGYVVLDKIAQQKTEGGFAVSRSELVNRRYSIGKVISVDETEPILKKGDTVFYDKGREFYISDEGVRYYVIRRGDIIGVK